MLLEQGNIPFLYHEMMTFMQGTPYAFSGWYCGITSNWQHRIGVHSAEEPFVIAPCVDNIDARRLENSLRVLGCDGATNKGGLDDVYVYAYAMKLGVTKP